MEIDVRYPAANARRQRRGTAVAELALLLPFLCFVFLITVDYARILYFAITIDNCAHNGAIYGGQVFDNQNQQWINGQTQYWQGPSGKMLSTEQAAADIDGANLSPALATTNVQVDNSQTNASGNPINIVTITYTFKTLSSFPGIPSSVTITRVLQSRVAPATPSS
jgi:hypothetical protein